MRIFKPPAFNRWAADEDLSNRSLKDAVLEIDSGLYEANLGSGLYKKRIAMRGKGKRGSYRTLVACQWQDKAFFLYGFAENERDSITHSEEKGLQEIIEGFARNGF